MSDLASQMRRALDQVEPVTLGEINAATRARRSRRRWVGSSGALAVVVAAVLIVAEVTSSSGTTRVITRPTGPSQSGPRPTSGGPSSGPVPLPLGSGPVPLESNPLFKVIRSVEIPTVATGSLYADGALFTWSDTLGQVSNVVTRININTARVTATASLTASGAALAGNLLWLTTYLGARNAGTGTVQVQVVALDPATLAVVHKVPIPTAPANGYDLDSIAAAGNLVWVVGADTLYGIDPATATIIRHIAMPLPPPTGGNQVGSSQYGIDIAAPPDRSVLWTAESPGGGGYDALQVRDPNSGDVINSSTASVGSVGNTRIAAADTYAWFAFGTGMSGSYVQVHNEPGLPITAPQNDTAGSSNAISVALTTNQLWVYDLESGHAACVDPTNGHILQESNVPIAYTTSLPNGQIAVISTGSSPTAAIVVADPTPACRS